jgi:hypothetical protein
VAYTPIPKGTQDWDVPVNDAFTSQDGRITTLENEIGGANYYFLVAASTAPESVKAKADFIADGLNDQLAIQQAVDAAFNLGGGIVQLSVGVFSTTAPVTLHPLVTLQGVHGDQIFNPGQLTSLSYIAPSATFVGGAAIVMLGQTAGGYTNKPADQRIRHLTIQGDASAADVHGIQASDYIHGVTLEDVAIVRVTGKGIYTFTENGAQPFSWTMRRVLVDNSNGVGIHLINHTDFTAVDVISIGAGGDNFVLSNMPNSRMIGCRAEWSEGHGYKIEGDWGTGAGSGGILFSGCSTDRNKFNGFDITSTGNAPITLTGCYTRRDGRNNNSGGGGFAGIYAAGATTPIIITGWAQYPGQDDNATGVVSPQVGGYFSNNTAVQIDGSYIHGATTAVTQSGNAIFLQGDTVVYTTGDTAAPIRTVPFDDSEFKQSDYGFQAWTGDPGVISGSGFTLAAGTVYLQKVKIVSQTTTISNVHTYVSTAGTALTANQCVAGIYDINGNRLAVTADQSGTWNSTGGKTMALTAPVALPAGYYYVALVANGTGTLPSVSGSAGNTGVTNVNLATGVSRALNTAAGNTSLPATITLGSQTPNIAVRWCALS